MGSPARFERATDDTAAVCGFTLTFPHRIAILQALEALGAMTCEKCNREFAADQNQGYPGHCDPPSSLIAYAVLFALVAAVFGACGIFFWRTFMFTIGGAFLAGTLVSLAYIPEARRVCERHDGGVCPACGHRNKVRWDS